MEEEGILERAQKLGAHLGQRLRAMQFDARLKCIGDVRGLGPMLAMELVSDPDSKAPAADLARHTTEIARERGLMLLACGLYSNVIRVLVPILAAEADVEEGLALLEESLAAATG